MFLTYLLQEMLGLVGTPEDPVVPDPRDQTATKEIQDRMVVKDLGDLTDQLDHKVLRGIEETLEMMDLTVDLAQMVVRVTLEGLDLMVIPVIPAQMEAGVTQEDLDHKVIVEIPVGPDQMALKDQQVNSLLIQSWFPGDISEIHVHVFYTMTFHLNGCTIYFTIFSHNERHLKPTGWL